MDVTRRPSWKRPLKSPWRPLTLPKRLSPVRRAPGRSVGVRCCGDRGQGWQAVVTGDHRNEEILSGLSFPNVTRAGLGLAQMGLVPSILLYMGTDLVYPSSVLGHTFFWCLPPPHWGLEGHVGPSSTGETLVISLSAGNCCRGGGYSRHARQPGHAPSSQATPSGQATPLQPGHTLWSGHTPPVGPRPSG